LTVRLQISWFIRCRFSELINIRENVPLAPLTTLEVGGPARFFFRAISESDVIEAFDFARQKCLPVFVLGGGSNILVSDAGFDGLVVQVGLRGIGQTSSDLRSPDAGIITINAGEDWDAFVSYCVGNGLGGVECLSGIPGTVGGTPVQNVGAYGQEVSETIVSVRCYDRRTNEIVELSNPECGFQYRVSIFNTTERERYVVLAVTYRLTKNASPKIVYKDLLDFFERREPTLAETREAVLSIRRGKSMVISAEDPNRRSAGSFFKNPIVSRTKFDEIAAEHRQSVPHFAAGDGRVKVPAAWLIERCGFSKGFSLGKAGISSKHTLAIINRGGATADEIVALKYAIQRSVLERFGIDLVPEPVFVGEFPAKR
jgi:UDP-N-acetylmuramate dehydrogenase